jgi:tRNA threonylcarbamoyladenosine biosynthesis protein TsaB
VIRVAIETATPLGTVAVGRGDELLAEVELGVQSRHAEAVLPALEAALARAGLDRDEIAEVVVGAGPGSFTGVRVAAATAKGLVAVLDRPLVAYPSLLALAAPVPADGPVCALFDARRGEVYAGCWQVTPRAIEELLEPMVGSVAAVVEALGRRLYDRVPPRFVGDGARRYSAVLAEAVAAADWTAPPRAVGGKAVGSAGESVVGSAGGSVGELAGESAGGSVGESVGSRAPGGSGPGDQGGAAPVVVEYPRASTLLWLATRHRDRGGVADVAGWEPLYVRGSSAERGVVG